MDRVQVVEALRTHAAYELTAVAKMQAAAVDEATGDESRAENKYDTRGLEASYLAAGQAQRVVALQRLRDFYDGLSTQLRTGPAGLGALVALEGEDGASWWFLAPGGGGTVLRVGGTTVRVVSPASPMGAALLGAEEGDEVSLDQPTRRSFEVVTVC